MPWSGSYKLFLHVADYSEYIIVNCTIAMG